MNRDNTPWWPVKPAALEWGEDGAPYSSHFDDVYYSRNNGLEESRYVFLEGNNLRQRWTNETPEQFCIAETGFGTGLNFLLSWQLWLQQPEPRPGLHYVSIEKFPLKKPDLARALAAWPELAPLTEQLLQVWPGLLPGQHRLLLNKGRITLDLWWEDVADALPDLASHGSSVDAWYLDGFAPSRNEAMWQDSMYRAMSSLSRQGATFATFTAAGQVRRGMGAAGFKVQKVPGFGRKRESLRGTLINSAEASLPRATPWDLPQHRPPQPRRVMVVGAGLAGCSVAFALARRGIGVSLLDTGPVAGQASGNEQGILYTRLSTRHSTLTDFALQSFRFAASLYQQMFAAEQLLDGIDGALRGSFHQHANLKDMATMQERLQAMPELAAVLSTEQAAQVLGVQPAQSGYWFPASGWLSPPAVCKTLIQHPAIELLDNCGTVSLQRQGDEWLARDGLDTISRASSVVICTGTSAHSMDELNWLPLQSIRGQTTHIPRSDISASLQAGFCHTGYIAPAREDRHCIGATFNLQDSDHQMRPEDHRTNIGKLAVALPAWREELARLDETKLSGRVGFRCASPDYLPIAGPVPDRASFLQCYAGLRKNARQVIPKRGEYVTGLYVNTAHGSRGLSSAPLVAEVLASQICSEPPPVSRELLRGLSPARFLMRDLSRNRI